MDMCSLTCLTHYFICLQDDSLDHSLSTMAMSVSMSGTNLYEAARLSGGSNIIENLQSQLKLREGEIAQLQVGIQNKPILSKFLKNVCPTCVKTEGWSNLQVNVLEKTACLKSQINIFTEKMNHLLL